MESTGNTKIRHEKFRNVSSNRVLTVAVYKAGAERVILHCITRGPGYDLWTTCAALLTERSNREGWLSLEKEGARVRVG